MDNHYTGMPNGWKLRDDYCVYGRKLKFANDLGFEMCWQAIRDLGGFKIFNDAFDKVSYKYPNNIN
tara:strand:+ start:718 stop:915 length:198 start_codon:yes stop_codon:yes gene_type:complete